MEVFLNRIDGWDDAILTMFYSKRTVTREFEQHVRDVVYAATNHDPSKGVVGELVYQTPELADWLEKLMKWTPKHITMGRFLDLSFTVYGIHRAGQDDLDAHAARMNNRIIRSSTRLADFHGGEMSEYYDGKVIPTDVALAAVGVATPDEIEYEGQTYVKGVNGYILKGMENNKDVKRGLYMLSIPSDFICKIDLTEFSHVYKERRIDGTANPEVKTAVEKMVDHLESASLSWINRQLLMNIKN